jgi:hypothetical protein
MAKWMMMALAIALANGVFAAETEEVEEKVIREEDRVEFKKQTMIDFSDVLVTGELMKPDGAYVKNRRKMQFNALIELRANFRPELMLSASEL